MPAAAHDPPPPPSQLPWQREGELGIPIAPGEHSWESSFPEWAQGRQAEALSLGGGGADISLVQTTGNEELCD